MHIDQRGAVPRLRGSRVAAAACLLALTLLVVLALPGVPGGRGSEPGTAAGADEGGRSARDAYTKLPLSFTPNRGQLDRRVRYHASSGGMSVYFTRDRMRLALKKGAKGAAIDLRFLGASDAGPIEAVRRLPGKANYLTGSDSSRWRTDIPTYGAVAYRELWPGIDMVFRSAAGKLKYEFLVSPGADPSKIKLAYEGASGLALTKGGDLSIRTGVGPPLTDTKPTSYQSVAGRRVPVQSRFSLSGGRAYGFELGRYDGSRPLTIDPGLVYSTYLGGASDDFATGITVGGNGNPFVAGYTYSADFPTTLGAKDRIFNAGSTSDIFVTKLDPTGSSLVYSTFIGGAQNDRAADMIVDVNNRVYITGVTESSDYPTSVNAYDTTYNDASPLGDAFVTKLNADGTGFFFSTLLGGSSLDEANGIAIDGSLNPYVTGQTGSTDFPISAGAVQHIRGGGQQDAFVTKLSPAGSLLRYSTFVGGNQRDIGTDLAVDAGGNAYVTGNTNSPSGFPTTLGAYDTVNGNPFPGGGDAFVTKVDANASRFLYSTLLGGALLEAGKAIKIDANGGAYVAGHTASADFPVTVDAYDQSFGGGTHDAFAAKLEPGGGSLGYSTFIGGADSDFAYGLALDARGRSWVTGQTRSSDFTTTSSAYDRTYAGGSSPGDAYVTAVEHDGALSYSTLFGGDGSDSGTAVAVDAGGAAVVAGNTASLDFPTTEGAYSRTRAGTDATSDSFVLRIADFYDQPKSATPLRVSLVPEYRQTISDSQCLARGGTPSSHGPPLSFASCDPPAYLPGTAARLQGSGWAELDVVGGDLASAVDEADLVISASLTDVRTPSGADYAPNGAGADMTLVARLRMTDATAGPGPMDAGTTEDFELLAPINCSPTANPVTGSTCLASTTIDAAMPGAVLEGRGTVVQAQRIRIKDAGANGTPSDLDDGRLASQGIYVKDAGENEPGVDPVIAAAGDIACDPSSSSFNNGLGTATSCRQKYTSDLLQDAGLTAVLPLGDLQYENGALSKYMASYDVSWGRSKAITYPVPGNHEYLTAGASGYYDYFNGADNPSGQAGDRTTGYYSYDIGTWHMIALNSNCSKVGGCGAGSPQEQWLRADLTAHPTSCTLAYWHHPRFAAGAYSNDVTYQPLWQALYDHRAEIVLNGHDHNFQRYAPQDPAGNADPNGIREFIVGSGGKGHNAVDPGPVPNREVADGTTAGVLMLVLRPQGYDWEFAPESGSFTDSGTDSCH